MNTKRSKRIAMVAGPLLALLVGAGTSSVRDEVGSTNVGIALAVIVVLAALTSRAAGLLTAATAALVYNYFHTEPLHSLRIHEARDVVIVALLAVTGLVVSDVTAWLRRRDVIESRGQDASEAPTRIAKMLSDPTPVRDAWPALSTMIMDQLSLADCRFERSTHTDLPLIARAAGHGDGDDGFVLPSTGAALAVLAGDRHLGYLVITPRTGITSLWVERRVVVALADHVAIALTYTGHTSTSTTENSHG